MKFTRSVLGRAVVASVWTLCASSAMAQNTALTPAELPPESFAGTQFVDSAGCVFIRAGVGDLVRWVPRVTQDRRLVCGFQPTFSQRQVRPPASNGAPLIVDAGSAVSVMALAATAPRKGAPSSQTASTETPHRDATVGRVVTPKNAASRGVSAKARVLPRHVYEERKAMRPVKVPKNHVRAWKDDRLNPRRAEQTLQGHADMQKVWTNTVPRRLVD